tara:strand:+ start:856 stop:3045 length:2190 start_codon:yes stop_codon:yes gene_type:complete
MDIVEKEWEARKEHGLPPYHAVDQTDIGFIYHQPQLSGSGALNVCEGTKAFLNGDFDVMRSHWKHEKDIRGVFTDTTPLYLGYSLPHVTEIRPTPKGFVAYLFCDGVYFRKFGAKLLASLGNGCHVHIMDGPAQFVEQVIDELGLDTGLTVEQPEANAEYYHSIRFIRWYEFMKKTGEYSCLLDVDALAHRPFKELPQVEIGMRLRPARLEPWNVCNASVCIGKANTYWKGVADYIYHLYKTDKMIWQIDQAALWAVWQRQHENIHTLGEEEVSYEYGDNSIIWCNSGKNKWQESDPTRQKYRDKFNTIIVTPRERINKELNDLEAKAKNELKSLNLKEAERLYLRLLRRCFENLPQKKVKTETVEKQERRVEKILYLPVEISARELASREWLAKQMKGWKVVIGNRWQMQNWHDLPPGVILWKSANTQDVGVFTDAINAGHLITLMDEELFPMQPLMELYKPSVDKRCLDYADMIFAHSDEQKQLFEQLTQTPVEVTGNPRSILATKIKGGNRNVLCTMVGTLNNFGRTFNDMVIGTVRLLGGVSEEVFDFLAYQISHEIQGYGLTRKAIDELENPLIRCHPSEDMSFWEGFGELDDRTPFLERLEDSRCIIHVSGCGTGLEASLAGIPTVRLGEGGHGLSARIGQGITENIKEAAVSAQTPTVPEFADVTLPNTIMRLQEKHSFKCNFDLKKAYDLIPFKPLEFHQNKFPKDPDGELIGWRTVLCQP